MYLIFILVILIIAKLVYKLSNTELFYSMVGLSIYQDNFLFTLVSVLTKLLLVFLTFNIYTYDLKNGLNNIFLRIKADKWFLMKFVSNFVFTSFLKAIIYIFIVIFIIFFPKTYFNYLLIPKIFCIDIIYTLCFQMFFLLLYFLMFYNKPMCGTISFIGLLSIKFLFPNMKFINNYWYIYSVILLALIFGLTILCKNNYVNLFERNSE